MEALGVRERVGETQSGKVAALVTLVGPDPERVGLSAVATVTATPLRIPVMRRGQVLGSERPFPRVIGMTMTSSRQCGGMNRPIGTGLERM